jgi:2'-deoxynucleoside 5'-phosphate N-hydrolase
MKVFISVKYHEDFANQGRVQMLCELARNHKMDPVCLQEMAADNGNAVLSPDELMRHTFLELRDSKLVIVDLTEKGVGVGIEAGYARARGIPVVVIAASGTEISESLVGIAERVFYYQDWEGLDRFMAEIEEQYVPPVNNRPQFR